MAQPQRYRKVVTEKEIRRGRISIPARVRDYIFPHLTQNTKNAVTMVDERGVSYPVIVKVRKNRTKPEIMAKGGKHFVLKRNLKARDALVFSLGESPDRFRVRVEKSRYSRHCDHWPAVGFAGFSAPSSPAEPALGQYLIGSAHAPAVGFAGFSAPSSPPEPALRQHLIGSTHAPDVGFAGFSAPSSPPEPALRQYLIGFDHAPAAAFAGFRAPSSPPGQTEPALRRFSIGSNHAPVIQKPATQPVVPDLGTPFGLGHAPIKAPAKEADAPVALQPASGVELGLSIGFGHSPTKPTPVPSTTTVMFEAPQTPPIKAPAKEADAPVELQPASGVELGLSIGFGHSSTKPTPVPSTTTVMFEAPQTPPKGAVKMAMAISSMGNTLYGVKAEEKEDEPNLELNLGSPDMKLSFSLLSGKLAEVGFAGPKRKSLFVAPKASHLAAVQELQEPKPPTALVLAPPSARFNFSPPLILSHKPSPIMDQKTIMPGRIPFEIREGSGRILEALDGPSPARFEGGTSKAPETTNKGTKSKLFGIYIP